MNYDPGLTQFSSGALRTHQVSIEERSLPPRETINHGLTDLVCSSAEQLLGRRWKLILANEVGIGLNVITRFSERRINVPQAVVEAVHRLALTRKFGVSAVASSLADWIETAPEDDYSDPDPGRTWPRDFLLQDLEAQDHAWEQGHAYDGPIQDTEPAIRRSVAPDLAQFEQVLFPGPEADALVRVLDDAANAPTDAGIKDIAHELRNLLASGYGKDEVTASSEGERRRSAGFDGTTA